MSKRIIIDNNKIRLEYGFLYGIGEPFYNDERYYKKINNRYKLISLSKLLKEQYPKKYKIFLEKERLRSKQNYVNNIKQIKCKCGCKIVEKALKKHLRSKKHNKLIKEINNI